MNKSYYKWFDHQQIIKHSVWQARKLGIRSSGWLLQNNKISKSSIMLAVSQDIEGVGFEGTKLFCFLFFLDKFCN